MPDSPHDRNLTRSCRLTPPTFRRQRGTRQRVGGLRRGDRRAHALLQALLVFRLPDGRPIAVTGSVDATVRVWSEFVPGRRTVEAAGIGDPERPQAALAGAAQRRQAVNSQQQSGHPEEPPVIDESQGEVVVARRTVDGDGGIVVMIVGSVVAVLVLVLVFVLA